MQVSPSAMSVPSSALLLFFDFNPSSFFHYPISIKDVIQYIRKRQPNGARRRRSEEQRMHSHQAFSVLPRIYLQAWRYSQTTRISIPETPPRDPTGTREVEQCLYAERSLPLPATPQTGTAIHPSSTSPVAVSSSAKQSRWPAVASAST